MQSKIGCAKRQRKNAGGKDGNLHGNSRKNGKFWRKPNPLLEEKLILT